MTTKYLRKEKPGKSRDPATEEQRPSHRRAEIIGRMVNWSRACHSIHMERGFYLVPNRLKMDGKPLIRSNKREKKKK